MSLEATDLPFWAETIAKELAPHYKGYMKQHSGWLEARGRDAADLIITEAEESSPAAVRRAVVGKRPAGSPSWITQYTDPILEPFVKGFSVTTEKRASPYLYFMGIGFVVWSALVYRVGRSRGEKLSR